MAQRFMIWKKFDEYMIVEKRLFYSFYYYQKVDF